MSENEVPSGTSSASSKLELEQEGIYGKYLLHSRTEIIFVLRAVLQKSSLITVYFDQGRSFLLTSLLDVDAERGTLTFDMGSDEEMNNRALKADRFVFTTSLDKVKVQFSLKRLELVKHANRPALRGIIPESVLRLQRREYYRLTTPVANPVRCKLTVKRPDGATVPMELPLLDISGGGVGLMVKPEFKEDFLVGTGFRDCRIELPEEGVLVCNLVVRNAFDVTTKSGNQHLRVGCEYEDLPGTRLTMIQRYITRVERERKARLSGME
ncbi:flagellar brake protein [Azospira restricta]|uniref:Flagellar brake protein YcgR n=1 Tax=Azospira restricta TaxID=404405 RepID=A0A974SSC2_9RHOO|nr:flagellar brake protein [Azospira restricta]QRJ65477.1 flagellar brake protein [Azospira restricta]